MPMPAPHGMALWTHPMWVLGWALACVILWKDLLPRYQDHHFTEKETEAQRGNVF